MARQGNCGEGKAKSGEYSLIQVVGVMILQVIAVKSNLPELQKVF